MPPPPFPGLPRHPHLVRHRENSPGPEGGIPPPSEGHCSRRRFSKPETPHWRGGCRGYLLVTHCPCTQLAGFFRLVPVNFFIFISIHHPTPRPQGYGGHSGTTPRLGCSILAYPSLPLPLTEETDWARCLPRGASGPVAGGTTGGAGGGGGGGGVATLLPAAAPARTLRAGGSGLRARRRASCTPSWCRCWAFKALSSPCRTPSSKERLQQG